MQSELQIGIIGSYYGRPLDILLPTLNEDDLSNRQNNIGHCFHIYDLANTELCLFRKNTDGTRRIAKLNIRSSCKPDCDISIYLVQMNDGKLYLRTYIDSHCNGLFPLPAKLYQQDRG